MTQKLFFDIIHTSKTKGKIKMTDRDKFIALVSYIKGAIGGSKYVATLNVEDFNSFLNSIWREEKLNNI